MHELWKQDMPFEMGGNLSFWAKKDQPFFENYFVIENNDSKSIPVYILPDTCSYLIVHEWHEKKENAIDVKIIGPRTTGFLINRKRRKKTILVKLKPEALFGLTGIQAADFKDNSVFIKEVNGGLEILNERVGEVLDSVEPGRHFFSMLEEYALKEVNSFRTTPILSNLMEQIKVSKEPLKLKNLAKDLGVSERYLRKICHQRIGLSPKQIIRIERFTKTIQKHLQLPNYTWSDIAHQCGYTDQSHLIADFQVMMGVTPVQLFK